MQLSINVPVNLLPNIPINALVTAHRPQSEKWPGLILELTEDQVVRDFSATREMAKELKSNGIANAAICQTAIDLAHRFDSSAVAGGIDTIADLQALIVMGCDFGQGALVAPPLPKDRFLDALRQHMNKSRAPEQPADGGKERVA